MSKVTLLNGKVAYVVLKPCTSFQDPRSFFHVKDGMFYPSKGTIKSLVAYLNGFKIGTMTGVDTVDPEYPEDVPPIRVGTITDTRLLRLGDMYECNILGAVFFSLLESFGFGLGSTIAQVVVARRDQEFFELIYPIFKGYFDTPRTSSKELDFYLRGVISNNTGIYTIVNLIHHTAPLTTALRQVAYLKRLYRYAVVSLIPYPPDRVHDNLVHSPGTQEELRKHSRIFRERLVS